MEQACFIRLVSEKVRELVEFVYYDQVNHKQR